MFESLPLLVRQFPSGWLWLMAAVCAHVLWDPSCQQPPDFRACGKGEEVWNVCIGTNPKMTVLG